MYNFVKYVIDFFLYSHLFIALCAVSIGLVTQLYIGDFIHISIREVFIFFATISLYSLHRIVGINKVLRHIGAGRFQKIRPLKSVLWIIVLIGGLIAAYIYVFRFEQSLQYYLVIPIVLSLAYVIPIWKGQRMRDIAYIKVFIIALVWSLITTVLPTWNMDISNEFINWVIIERFLFILAITIPFDIRDLGIDQQQGVKTLPSRFGVRRVKWLSLSFLLVALVIQIVLWSVLNLSLAVLCAHVLTYGFTGFLISLASTDNTDYYFSGWLDATMILLLIMSYGLNTLAYYLF